MTEMTINTFLNEMEQLLGCDGYISILENTRKLKEENEELESEVACLESDSCIDYAELKEENEELKQQISDITDAVWDESYPDVRTDLLIQDIHKFRQEVEELKEENEEQLAAVEALKFMDYTYNDGSWMEKEEEDEEEVNVKGTITLTSDTEPYEEMIIRFNNMITKEQYEDEDFMDNIDDKLNLLSGFHTNGYDIQIDFE